jgi:hypothetical protein
MRDLSSLRCDLKTDVDDTSNIFEDMDESNDGDESDIEFK